MSVCVCARELSVRVMWNTNALELAQCAERSTEPTGECEACVFVLPRVRSSLATSASPSSVVVSRRRRILCDTCDKSAVASASQKQHFIVWFVLFYRVHTMQSRARTTMIILCTVVCMCVCVSFYVQCMYYFVYLTHSSMHTHAHTLTTHTRSRSVADAVEHKCVWGRLVTHMLIYNI